MSASDFDVAVIGAGAAGLAAFRELDRAGCKVICIEARDRIGGRIFTVHDPLSPVPIELGAEFVHGRSPEIWNLIHSGRVTAYDCSENAIHIENRKVQNDGESWELIDQVMEDLQRRASEGEEETFLKFLEESKHPENAKRLATSFVEGFNAAHKEVIGIASLAEDARAAKKIDGDHSFRILNGYDSLMLHLLDGVSGWPQKLRLNAIVEKINWQAGSARIGVRSARTGALQIVRSHQVIITVPLGVLHADQDAPAFIGIDPEPGAVLSAARALRFGQVMRVVLRFREPFWEDDSEIATAGFLLSNESFFPTWWTTLPVRTSVLTGWSAGPHADDLLAQAQPDIIERALADLARITRSTPEKLNSLLEASYLHDWHVDPFSRGAYSYVPAGALDMRRVLAEPVEQTLLFAGEATELNGHSATVHGAIASGKRAARQILESSR